MDVQAIDQTQATGQAAAATPTVGLPAFPAAGGPAQDHQMQQIPDATLHHALSQLVGGGSHVAVQFRVVGPNEIVTVFKNADTGEVITQFPSEAMVLIAQFFNKLAGAVVDRTA
ncbi:MAG TPA: flagellar protein FlaG [Dongiaceae bacterium]|nr:flagellar protein FlaG [Dongiaceae bacterium]